MQPGAPADRSPPRLRSTRAFSSPGGTTRGAAGGTGGGVGGTAPARRRVSKDRGPASLGTPKGPTPKAAGCCPRVPLNPHRLPRRTAPHRLRSTRAFSSQGAQPAARQATPLAPAREVASAARPGARPSEAWEVGPAARPGARPSGTLEVGSAARPALQRPAPPVSATKNAAAGTEPAGIEPAGAGAGAARKRRGARGSMRGALGQHRGLSKWAVPGSPAEAGPRSFGARRPERAVPAQRPSSRPTPPPKAPSRPTLPTQSPTRHPDAVGATPQSRGPPRTSETQPPAPSRRAASRRASSRRAASRRATSRHALVPARGRSGGGLEGRCAGLWGSTRGLSKRVVPGSPAEAGPRPVGARRPERAVPAQRPSSRPTPPTQGPEPPDAPDSEPDPEPRCRRRSPPKPRTARERSETQPPGTEPAGAGAGAASERTGEGQRAQRLKVSESKRYSPKGPAATKMSSPCTSTLDGQPCTGKNACANGAVGKAVFITSIPPGT